MAIKHDKEKKILVAPSLLSADMADFAGAIKAVEGAADWLHLDVMDGQYVPNLTFGAPVCKALRSRTEMFIDAHLMVYHPENFLDDFVKAGANSFVFHYEATKHVQRLLQATRAAGLVAGIALNPGTPVTMLEDLLPDLDLILIMTVNPGFSGQSFIPQMISKITKAKQMIATVPNHIWLQVDGGVNEQTISSIYQAGADIVVAGQAAYGQVNPRKAILKLKQVALQADA